MQRRVAVTGLGVISALGHNAREFWDALRGGPVRHRSDRVRRAGPAPLPERRRNPRTTIPSATSMRRSISLLDRFAQFGVVAAREASASACIEWTPALREATAIVTGSCVGGQTTEDEGFVNLYRNNSPRVNPLTIPRTHGERRRQPHLAGIPAWSAPPIRSPPPALLLITPSARRSGWCARALRTWPSPAAARRVFSLASSKRGKRCAWFRRTPAVHSRKTAAA